jgi:hypothetical protein
MQNIDPIFVKISENLDTPDVLHDLKVTPFEIKVGDVFNIGGRAYAVHKIYKEGGGYAIKNSDLKKNIKAYEELKRTSVIGDYRIDDLCLVNTVNGDVLIEVSVPKNIYQKDSKDLILYPSHRTFFVRLDGSMINNVLSDKNIPFDETEIKLTPCMFASDSALAFTQSGKSISITERNVAVEEKITHLYTSSTFTLYEREIVSRLVGAVNLLGFNKKIDKITTALPRGAYYSFLFQASADGLVTPETVLDWFDKVDTRVKHLQLLIKKGIHQFHPEIPIAQYSFMDSACEMMRSFYQQRVEDRKTVDIQALFNLVIDTLKEKDSFAKQLFEMPSFKKPETFLDLCNFTYAIGNLTDMEQREDKKPMNKQIIGVYDVSETMMWSVTKKIRNMGLLEPRGQFNAKIPQNSSLDNLSFISVMPIEHVIFDISPEFAEKYMGGFTRLYSVRNESVAPDFAQEIFEKTLSMRLEEELD